VADIDEVRFVKNGEWVPVPYHLTNTLNTTTHWFNDSHAPPNTPVRYRARGINASGTVSQWTEMVGTVTWTPVNGAWFKSVDDDRLNFQAPFRDFPSPTRGRRQGVHHVIGARNETVTSDKRGGRVGTWQILTTTDTKAAELEALFEQSTILVHTPPGNRFAPGYFAVGEYTPEAPDNATPDTPHRVWTVEYREVDRP
jgi:hypothetical protein